MKENSRDLFTKVDVFLTEKLKGYDELKNVVTHGLPSHLANDIQKLKKERDKVLQRLGEQTFQLLSQGKLIVPGVVQATFRTAQEVIERISRIEMDSEALQPANATPVEPPVEKAAEKSPAAKPAVNVAVPAKKAVPAPGKPVNAAMKKVAAKSAKPPAKKPAPRPAKKPVKKPAKKPVKKPARKPVKKPAKKALAPKKAKKAARPKTAKSGGAKSKKVAKRKK